MVQNKQQHSIVLSPMRWDGPAVVRPAARIQNRSRPLVARDSRKRQKAPPKTSPQPVVSTARTLFPRLMSLCWAARSRTKVFASRCWAGFFDRIGELVGAARDRSAAFQSERKTKQDSHSLPFFPICYNEASSLRFISDQRLPIKYKLCNIPLLPLWTAESQLLLAAPAGIGLETTRAFLENGAKVVIVDLDIENGNATSKNLGVQFIHGDVTDSKFVAQVAADVKERYGRIDVAFNNAGIAHSVPGRKLIR
jgi:hypothetical protein